MTIVIDKVVIWLYVGEGYQTWDIHSSGVLIGTFYRDGRLGCREAMAMLFISRFLGSYFPLEYIWDSDKDSDGLNEDEE